MRSGYLLLALFVVQTYSGFPISGQEGNDDPVRKLRNQFEREMEILERPLRELNVKYRQHLEERKEASQRRRDLKALLAFDQELKTFLEAPSEELSSFTELKRLQEIYRRQRTDLEKRAADNRLKIRKSFTDKAEQLAREWTKAGKIDEAKRMLAEFERFRERKPVFGDDLVLFYHFDSLEPGEDASPSRNHGTAVNLTFERTDAIRGHAACFRKDGAGFSSGSPIAITGDRERTICAWVKLEELSPKERTLIFSTGAALGPPGSKFAILINNKDRRVFFHGHNRDLTFSPAFPVGEWVHLAVTYNEAGEMRLFLNGEEKSRKTIRLDTKESRLQVGHYDTRIRFYGAFRGKIDEVMVFKRALNGDEIRAVQDGVFLPE